MIQLLAKLQGVAAVAPPRRTDDKVPGAELRKSRRTLSLFWAATLKAIGWSGPAVVVDISAGGMRLKSALNPTLGTQVIIELPGVEPLRGNVRWADDGRFGVQLDTEINVIEVMRAHRLATGSHLGVDLSV